MLNITIRTRAAAVVLAGSLPGCGLAAAVAPLGLVWAAPAHAQDADTAFVRALGAKLTAVVNGPGSAADKKSQVLPLLSQDVDVDAIGRFTLGRFWRLATPAQQERFLGLFHQVLVNAITGHLGDYKGVTITIGQAAPDGDRTSVPSVINRPGQPPANVQWIVSSESGSPKVVDLVAEGVSLSLTQRSDYESYLQHNNGSIDALINALSHQVSRQS